MESGVFLRNDIGLSGGMSPQIADGVKRHQYPPPLMGVTKDDDAFVEYSSQARTATATAVRRAVEAAEVEARIALAEGSAVLAPFMKVFGPHGEVVAEIQAHADGANVLVGTDEVLCSFDDGTLDERAQQVAGAVAVLLVLSASSP